MRKDRYSISEDWLARHREEAVEPDLPIIDAHHHLWDRIGNRYLLPELLADVSGGHDIRATIYVEATSMYRADGPDELRSLGETEFANGVAAMAHSGVYGSMRACAGIIARIDMSLGENVACLLAAHRRAASDRFKGIRLHAQWDGSGIATGPQAVPGKDLLRDERIRRGFAQLSTLGLVGEIVVFHPQLPDVADFARQFEDTTIVLNHIGLPLGIGPYAGKREEVFLEWRRGIRAVAACQNVWVKLGGMAGHLIGFDFRSRETPPGSDELAALWSRYLWTVIDAFGPERCLFESDFPVDKEGCSYTVLWNAFKKLTTRYSASERAAMFSGTAAKLYGISIL